jgi:hypothetical protein
VFCHFAKLHFALFCASICADTVFSSKAMSVLKIEYPDTMDETKTRVKVGGLLDPRLGTIGIMTSKRIF